MGLVKGLATAVLLMSITIPAVYAEDMDDGIAHAQTAEILASLDMQTPPEQPDTSSPLWRQLDEDVGLLLAQEGGDHFSGRIYFRFHGSWYPVAVEGIWRTLRTEG